MVKAVNVSKTYYQGKTKIEAIKNLSLEIAKNETLLINGPSGAGKSTLLHLIGGLDKPTKGSLFFNGIDFYSLADKSRSRIRNEKVGFIFQFYHLLSEFTVLENVMLPAMIQKKQKGRSGRSVRADAEYLLGLVRLGNRANHKPRELSGGESQRVAIARSLINSPEILLCDEPTGNLDSKLGQEIISCIWELKDIKSMSLVLVTHDEHIKGPFDRRMRIRDGILEDVADLSKSRVSNIS